MILLNYIGIMNWYGLYKLAYNVSKDDILASKISKDIFSVIKENIGKSFYKDMRVDSNCGLNLYTSYENYKALRYDTFDVRAFFSFSKEGYFEPSIRVDFVFSNQFSKKYFDKLYYVIFDALKHELGHYYQYRQKEKSLYNGNEDQKLSIDQLSLFINERNTLLSERELIPYIKGLVFTSKKQNKPFTTVVDESLNSLFFGNIELKNKILTSPLGSKVSEIILEIKNVVVSKAKQLYPYLEAKI
jgi:transposase